MKNVVITGGTRGIGFGLAQEFLRRGHRVTLCGRSEAGTARAVAALADVYGPEWVQGQACDVTRLEQVQELWDEAVLHAGLNAPRQDAWALSETTLREVVEVNLLGMMYGSRVALRGMLQQGSGQLYNMEGLGSNGMVLPGSVLYGATKAALTYFTKGLVLETKNSPVQVGFLSPGIVLTDLFTGGKANLDARTKRVANILGDRGETVTPFLVHKMLANTQHGAQISWLTRPKIIGRFLTARFRQRDLFAEG